MNSLKKVSANVFLGFILLLSLYWLALLSEEPSYVVFDTIFILCLSFPCFLAAKSLMRSAANETFKITMLGASRVGKTSLLAAIYDRLDRTSTFQIQLDPKSKSILNKRLKELKNVVANPDSIKPDQGIKGNVDSREFSFKLGIASTFLTLKFQDFPGEYIESQSDLEKIKSIENFLKESSAVLIAIDTPSLMERKGEFHEEFNHPKKLLELFKKAYSNLDSQKLVIFVPVKCETYVKTERDAENLARAVKDGYKELLNFFHQEKLEHKVSVVITPVQTLGSLYFSRIKKDENNRPIFYFCKPDPDASYNPKDCDQPLKYLLRFLLNLTIKNINTPVIGKSFKKELDSALLKIANGCKEDIGSFEILQGEHLLSISGK